MARIEWVKQRLENWAMWKARESCGGLGYATQSSFLKDVAMSDRYRECQIPVDEIDASVTNTAVESLRPTRQHLHDTLHCIYVKGIGIKQTARVMSRAESTIKANLDQADHVLSVWFADRSQKVRK